MTLNDKLREVLLKGTATFDGDKKRIFWSNDDVIAQIKQAFAEEGYWKMDKKKSVASIIGLDVMTGQKWFGRFEKELDKGINDISGDIKYVDILEAAKKASGLK